MKESMQKNTFLSLSGTLEKVLRFSTSLTRFFQDGDKSSSTQKSDLLFLSRVVYTSACPAFGGWSSEDAHVLSALAGIFMTNYC